MSDQHRTTSRAEEIYPMPKSTGRDINRAMEIIDSLAKKLENEPKIFRYESLEETLSFAESLDWSWDWENQGTDTLEDAAIEHIKLAGYLISYPKD